VEYFGLFFPKRWNNWEGAKQRRSSVAETGRRKGGDAE